MKKKLISILMAGIMTVSLGLNGNAAETSLQDTQNATDMQSATDTQSEDTTETDVLPVMPQEALVKSGYVPSTLMTPPEIVGKAGIVVDVASGYTLYEKNINEMHYPASITKIMTATLALENLELSDSVTFSHNAVYSIEPGSSSAYAAEGEVFTVEQCLYGLMLISGNDLANGLAEKVSGSVEQFAELMTKKAKELGCISTQFKNPHGLHDEGHYTTAFDMAIIAINAYQNFEEFRTLCSTVRYDMPPTAMCEETRYWLNNNRMIREGEEYYYPACIGGKTGFTNEAGGTLVTYANINNRLLACVIMGSTNSATAYADSISLYDYVAANATESDFAALDERAKEDAAVVAAAKAALETTAKPVEKKTVKSSGKEEEKKSFSLLPFLFILFLAGCGFYGYVLYQRYLYKKRRVEKQRRRKAEYAQQQQEEEQMKKKMEERRKKFKTFDL